MPKFIDVKAASRVGARYDDGKRVSPFLVKPPPSPEALKEKAEAEAQATLLQAINSLKDAVIAQERAAVPQILGAIDQLQGAVEQNKPNPAPSFDQLVFEHQRDADGKITSTIVYTNAFARTLLIHQFVFEHQRDADGKIINTIVHSGQPHTEK